MQTKNDLDHIAVRIRNRREKLGITQDKLTVMSGISIATIKRFENFKTTLNMKQYVALCKALELSFLPEPKF